MFRKIFFFELNSWFNKPAFYLYAFLSAGFAALLMAVSAGVFDSNTATVTSLKYVNSPNGLLNVIMGSAVYIFLLFPIIMGASIHKDYKYNVHKVMYSFPFDKPSYFWGKYLSALFVAAILVLLVGVGTYAGTIMPGVNSELLGPQKFMPYVEVYAIYTLPGLLLLGTIVFAVVTFSRSVIAAFVVMIAIYVLQGVGDAAMTNNEWDKAAALLDPFGMRANLYYTKYWTIAEENNSNLPFKGLVIWNRILWTALGIILMIWSYLAFRFKVDLKGWKLLRRKKTK